MHYQKKEKKKKSKLVPLIALLLVALLLVSGAAYFVTAGGLDSLPPLGAAPTPFVAQGTIEALTLKPTGGDISEGGLKTYYSEAIAFAKANAINTLIFEGKSNLSVYWRDTVFPVAEEIAAQDSFFKKIDPLALLCGAAKDSGIQIWVSADVYNAQGYTSEMKGKAAKHAKELGGAFHFQFAVDDHQYTELLVDSFTRLPHKYPIAGVLFANLNVATGSPAPEPELWNKTFTNTLTQLRAAWSEKKYPTSLSLAFNGDEGALLTSVAADNLCGDGLVQYLLPSHAAGGSLSHRMAVWNAGGAKILSTVPAEKSEVVLFTAAASASFSGALYDTYPAVQNHPARLGLLRSILVKDEGVLPVGFDIPQTLSVNYPAQGATIYTSGLFILGNSNPDEPLQMNGVEVPRRTENGAFGIAVEIVTGENSFVFTQSDSSYTLTVTKPEPSGGIASPMPQDATKEARPGQAIRIDAYIASGLTDATNDGSINETYYKGGIGIVQESVQTVRYDPDLRRDAKTWAYKLTNGDYVLARNCVWIEGDGKANFTGLAAESTEGGEWINFVGTGAPLAHVAYGDGDGTISITMHDTTFTLPESFKSEYLKSASVRQGEGGSVVLTLQTESIWGYSLEYAEGQTRLFLKKTPVQSDDPTKPLLGVRVMLDPGHGGDDSGAPGIMTGIGPFEKDINLVLAQTIAYRLRQLGAEVLMTRTEDTTVSLMDRLAAQTDFKPDFFLSVHHDSVELTRDLNDVVGMKAFYFHPYNTPPSKQYAQNLVDSIAPATGREVAQADWGYYYVTRTTICPSVLFEYGFVVIPSEFELITSTDGIYAAALATVSGILMTVPTQDSFV